MNKQNQSGYTMVEMLVAVVIISFIGIVLFSVFSQGLNLWKRANEVRPGLNARIFIEKLSSDLRNAVSYESQPVVGNKNSIEFYSIRGFNRAEIESRQIASVQYGFDQKQKNIYRASGPYTKLLLSTRQSPEKTPLLSGVKDWGLAFYEFDSEKKIGMWRSNWVKQCLPNAVKVSIDYEDVRSRRVTSVIPILSGTCG